MRSGLFMRLAVTNMKKNRGTYLPYLLSCMGCTAMLYMMYFILNNPGLSTVQGGSDIRAVGSMGTVVICIFSFIFLVYSNSFLMKRRQKELGLYNILGMEKRHISRMLFLETVITFVLSLAGGLAAGILGSKLALLILLKLAHIPAQFGFFVSVKGILTCFAMLGVTFLLILLNNMRRVHLNQPIELLMGGNAGEREPKAKWLLALLGFLCLGAGYYIAVTTTSPLEALTLFLVAVLLVMAGTYLVFTAGSISVLKMMRWKKSFYYRTKNFTSISGMLYRMKQNAVGLASICILSTGVLLMLSTTVCLYAGVEDVVRIRYPYEINLSMYKITGESAQGARQAIEDTIREQGIVCEDSVSELTLSASCVYEDGRIIFKEPDNIAAVGVEQIVLVSAEEYERITGMEAGLSDGQLLAYRDGQEHEGTLDIAGKPYQVTQWLTQWPLYSSEEDVIKTMVLVVTDSDFAVIDEAQRNAYGEYAGRPNIQFGINIDGDKEEEAAAGRVLGDALEQYMEKGMEDGTVPEEAYMYCEIRQESYESVYSLYGGLFFLGIFLGGLFLMGTAMIIYYKQISEGYEDKERFAIMQKVGMSRREVKSAIRRQILMVFFLPLLMASVHIIMAFPLIKRIMSMLYMSNTELFVICTAGTIVVFALVYAVIYGITARSYYKIVERTV